MMEFFWLWLWYLLAFGAGVVVMAVIVRMTVKAGSAREAVEHRLGHDEGSRR